MRTENLTRSLFDQRFIAVHPLRETAGRKPIGRVLRLHFELQSNIVPTVSANPVS